jgi:hypothetical protein
MTQFTPQHWRNLLRFYDRRNSPEAAMEEGTLDNPENRRTSDPPPSFSPSELEGVARYLDTDPDFWVFRRFRKLHLVNVLRMELDLVRLEHKLDKQLPGGRRMRRRMILIPCCLMFKARCLNTVRSTTNLLMYPTSA